MALSIKDDATDAAVRKLAALKNVSMSKAIKLAVDNELAKSRPSEAEVARRLAAITKIQEKFASLPVIDPDVNDGDWMYD